MSLEQKILADVEAILGPRGLIATAEGGSYRPEQYAYARRVAQGLARFDGKRTSINIQQAATGIGKSLGYLVPLLSFAAHEGKRVGVSTYTRHLQRQLLDNDIPRAAAWVEERTGVKLVAALRLGMGNFLSAQKVSYVLNQIQQEASGQVGGASDIQRETMECLTGMLEWLKPSNGNSGLLADFLEDHGRESLPTSITHVDIALESSCRDQDKAAYFTATEAAKAADLVVMNHVLLALNAIRWENWFLDAVDNPMAALVADEADKLTDAAELCTGGGFHPHSMTIACRNFDTESAGLESKAFAFETLLSSRRQGGRQHDLVWDKADIIASAAALLKDMKHAIGTGTKELFSLRQQDVLTDAERQRSGAIARFLDQAEDLSDMIASSAMSDLVISWSPVRAWPSLQAGRKYPARILARMYKQASDDREDMAPRQPLDAILYTSATIAVETARRPLPGAFDDFAREVDLIRYNDKSGVPVHNACVDLYAIAEPSNFGSMNFVLADPRVVNPTLRAGEDDEYVTNPEWLAYAAQMITFASSRGNGKTLVLTTSWGDAVSLSSMLSEAGADVVETTQGSPLNECLPRFRDPARPGAVLVTPAAWEGLDEPGLIKNLVITRIPFVPPDSGMLMHQRVSMMAKGMSAKTVNAAIMGESLRQTLRKLAQGLGRGIRQAGDDVTVWISDPRFPMPESFDGVLDPVLLNGQKRQSKLSLRYSIPTRFRDETFQDAKIFLEEGYLHAPLGA